MILQVTNVGNGRGTVSKLSYEREEVRQKLDRFRNRGSRLALSQPLSREPVTVTHDINDDFQRIHEKVDDKGRIFDDGHRRDEQKQSDFLVILDFLKEKSERDGNSLREATK